MKEPVKPVKKPEEKKDAAVDTAQEQRGLKADAPGELELKRRAAFRALATQPWRTE